MQIINVTLATVFVKSLLNYRENSTTVIKFVINSYIDSADNDLDGENWTTILHLLNNSSCKKFVISLTFILIDVLSKLPSITFTLLTSSITAHKSVPIKSLFKNFLL